MSHNPVRNETGKRSAQGVTERMECQDGMTGEKTDVGSGTHHYIVGAVSAGQSPGGYPGNAQHPVMGKKVWPHACTQQPTRIPVRRAARRGTNRQ